MKLMEGSEAIAEAAIAARVPVLRRLPDDAVHRAARALRQAAARGGRRLHQRRERARGRRAWRGARSPPARAPRPAPPARASRSCRSRFSEITLAELPLVIFNMARGQQDYFQSTRGGGHGDYRHIVLAPDGHRRGGRAHAARVPPRRQVAQPGARLRRLPARPHPGGGRRRAASTSAPLPAKDWAVDGSLGGTGRSRHRLVARLRQARQRRRRASSSTSRAVVREAARRSQPPRCGSRPATSTTPRPWSSRSARRASSCATSSSQLRAEGEQIGYVRPDHALAVPVRGRGARPPKARARRRRVRAERRAR